jgi:lysophospholipase L1-like esterase
MQQTTITVGNPIPFVVKAGEYLKVALDSNSAGTASVPGESIADTLIASNEYFYGKYSTQREVIVRLTSGSATVTVDTGAPPVAAKRNSSGQTVLDDASRAALSASGYIATPASGGDLTTIFLGDSQMAYQTETVPIPFYTKIAGFFHWANALSGAQWRLIRNAGVGGNNTKQCLDRIDAEVIPYAPTACDVCIGTNDIAPGASITNLPQSETLANLAAIYDKLRGAGIWVRAYSVLPRAGFDAAMAARALAINDFIKSYWSAHSGGEYIDIFTGVVDYTSTTCAPKAGLLTDGTHCGNVGAFTIGSIIAPYLSASRWVRNSILPSSVAQDYAINNAVAQYARNPMCTGTGGTLQSGNTGTAPDYFTAFTTASVSTVHSVADNADGVGKYHQLAMTASAAAAPNNQITLSAIPDGATFQIVGQVTILAGATSLAGVGLQFVKTGVEALSAEVLFGATSGGSLPITSDTTITYRSLPITKYAGDSIAGLYFRSHFNAAGSATVRRSKFAIVPATKLV